MIVGADLGFQKESLKSKMLRMINVHKGDKNHFFDGYGTPGFSAETLNLNMVKAHEIAKHNANNMGVEIFNATLGGKLEVYQRIKLSDLKY